MTYTVVMVRHGESQWTKENRFCGWYNAPLSEKGISEGREAGRLLKEAGLKFEIAFTSVLSRACETLNIIRNETGSNNLKVVKSWRINERHYGSLTGMKKETAVEKYGLKQVQVWRRSFDILPPPMESSHPYHNKIVEEMNVLAKNDEVPVVFPQVESLKKTMERVVPFWTSVIVPLLKKHKKILIVTHGTSLRSLIKYLDNVSDTDINSINLPTGIPFLYELDENMKPVKPMKYLCDEATVIKGIKKAASINATAN